MPYPRNPNNLAVEHTLQIAADFLDFIKTEYPERLGEGPLPQRERRLGEEPADPIIQDVANLIQERRPELDEGG